MFEKICIIGCGLIGSSILRNINDKKICKRLTVYEKIKRSHRSNKKRKLM